MGTIFEDLLVVFILGAFGLIVWAGFKGEDPIEVAKRFFSWLKEKLFGDEEET